MPDSSLCAHSVPDRDTDAWEPLSDHLAAVAARAAGLLHDVGKATPGFQAYIRGRGISPDHSTFSLQYRLENRADYGRGYEF